LSESSSTSSVARSQQAAAKGAFANAFVGMVSARSWRQGMDFDKAIGFLMEDVGRKFDRRVVTALANYIDNRGGRDAWKSFGETPEAAE